MTTDIDVLNYWYDYRKMLPCLAYLARYILCFLTTSGSTKNSSLLLETSSIPFELLVIVLKQKKQNYF